MKGGNNLERDVYDLIILTTSQVKCMCERCQTCFPNVLHSMSIPDVQPPKHGNRLLRGARRQMEYSLRIFDVQVSPPEQTRSSDETKAYRCSAVWVSPET